jgi:hypothetical protein
MLFHGSDVFYQTVANQKTVSEFPISFTVFQKVVFDWQATKRLAKSSKQSSA